MIRNNKIICPVEFLMPRKYRNQKGLFREINPTEKLRIRACSPNCGSGMPAVFMIRLTCVTFVYRNHWRDVAWDESQKVLLAATGTAAKGGWIRNRTVQQLLHEAPNGFEARDRHQPTHPVLEHSDIVKGKKHGGRGRFRTNEHHVNFW